MRLSIATVSFAAIVASLIAMPTPRYQATSIVAAKTDRLPVEPAVSRCSQQNWPNFEAACLHYTDDKQAVRDIRIAVGDQG
ncbi:MAG: hypothetical protein ABI192_04775 [Bradyrhizobium sp.]